MPGVVMFLYDLSVATLGKNIINVVENLLREESTTFNEITEPLERLFLQIQDVPPCYHAKIIDICLEVACLLSRSQCCSKREFAIKHLISILTRLKPKKVAFPFCTGDLESRKFVYSAVFDSFKQMEELEKLIFQFPKKYRLGEHQFLKSCPALKNLVSISTLNVTNDIARAICENCYSIQEIDLSHSKRVTNKCIANLIKCKKLRKVDLSGTSVSIKGYAKLLLGTQSVGLLDIGNVSDLDTLLRRLKLQTAPGHAFQLQKLSSDGNITNLHLVPTFFPNIIELDLEFNELAPDIAPLDLLKNVEEVAITFHPEAAEVFTNLNCHVLTYLNLSYWPFTHTLEIKITTLMKIGLQCPNIETLGLCSFSFVDDTGSIDFYELLGRPFQKLRDLHLSACSQVSCFKVILGHTFSIEFIEVRDKADSLTDEFFEYILNSNPLERLDTLMIYFECNISAHILKRLISHCKKISCLGDLSRFVTLSEQQVQEIRSLMAIKRYQQWK